MKDLQYLCSQIFFCGHAVLPYPIVFRGISVVFSSILSLSFCVFFCRKGFKKKKKKEIVRGGGGRGGGSSRSDTGRLMRQ